MSETLGEIQERLRPDHLIQQAKDTVTEAASGKVRNIMYSASETATRVADQTRYAGRSAADYVRMHPVQMALLAGGITWWLLRGQDRSDDWEGASEGWQDSDAAAYGADRSLREKAGEYVSSARETVGEYAETAKETAQRASQSVRDAASTASQSVRDAASTASLRARETWQSTSTTVDDWVHENPLAAGALAVAVGAAIGLSVPSSRFEDRTLGERRDIALERARVKARELKDTVTQRAKNVANAVEDLTAPTSAPTSSTSGIGVSGTSPSTTGSV
jgi:ElaB/YqjD/DUF883 family membrane-anchored ribosome-binding protein